MVLLWQTVEKKIKSLKEMGILEGIYSVKLENVPVHYVHGVIQRAHDLPEL